MKPSACHADIVGLGEVRPAPAPVSRPAPAAIAQTQWQAYRLEAATEQSLLPAERVKRLGRGQAMAIGAVGRAVQSCAAPPEKSGATAICLGSGWAEEGDEICFLENLVKFGEKGAKPAFFVNSVHNARASQVALNHGFRGENQTFTHDALSFESALWQGARLLCAGRARHAAVVGVDALCEFLEIHGHLLGYLGTSSSPLSPLSGQTMQGSLPGEGAAAFILAPAGSTDRPLARVVGVRARGPLTRAPALDAKAELAFVEQAAADIGVKLADVGLFVLGANGDSALEPIYAAVAEGLRRAAPKAGVGVYRHLTGDYATASALGFALAVRAVHQQSVPAELRLVGDAPGAPLTTALLYHVSRLGHHSVMVVSA